MQLLKRYGEHARVDVLDRLPTPFGLVRSGVAPDHPDTKVRFPPSKRWPPAFSSSPSLCLICCDILLPAYVLLLYLLGLRSSTGGQKAQQPTHSERRGAAGQNVINQFTALGRDPRVSFLGNVAVGRDIQLPDLRSFYNAVRLASSAYLTERDYRVSVLCVLISQSIHECWAKHSANACMRCP